MVLEEKRLRKENGQDLDLGYFFNVYTYNFHKIQAGCLERQTVQCDAILE